MNTVKFLDTLPVNDKDIAAIEELIEHDLSDEIKNFFRLANYGRPCPGTFDVEIDGSSRSPSWSLVSMVSGRKKGGITLLSEIEMMEDRIPKDAIPIGSDLGGNLLLYFFRGRYTGEIWFWDHEDEWEIEDLNLDEQGAPIFRNIHFVAKDLATFLDSLYEGEEEFDE